MQNVMKNKKQKNNGPYQLKVDVYILNVITNNFIADFSIVSPSSEQNGMRFACKESVSVQTQNVHKTLLAGRGHVFWVCTNTG